MGQGFHRLRHKGLGLPASGAIADRDQLNVMGLDQVPQGLSRLLPLGHRLVGKDRLVMQKLAGGVNHRHLATGAKAGIDRQGGLHPGGGRQQ